MKSDGFWFLFVYDWGLDWIFMQEKLNGAPFSRWTFAITPWAGFYNQTSHYQSILKHKTHSTSPQTANKHFAIISPNQPIHCKPLCPKKFFYESRRHNRRDLIAPEAFHYLCVGYLLLHREILAQSEKVIYVIHVIVTLLSVEFFIVCGAASLGLLESRVVERQKTGWKMAGYWWRRASFECCSTNPIPLHTRSRLSIARNLTFAVKKILNFITFCSRAVPAAFGGASQSHLSRQQNKTQNP